MKNRICLMAVVGAVIESFLPLYAENKTGLQTPYVWMRTSSVSSDPDNNYFWKDLNGNNVKLNLNEQERVNGRSDIYTYNFYPSFPFTDDANSLLRIEGTGLQKATVIGVFGYSSEDDHTEDGFVLNMSNGTDDDETVITKANVIHPSSSSRKSFGYKDRNLKAANKDEQQKSLRIMSYTKSTNPRQTVASTFNNISIGGQYVDGVTSKVGSFDAETFKDAEKAKRNMSVPELLVYDKALTNEARLEAETYLALKYGITLDVDYTLDEEYGNKGVVWKKDNYARVCGYGRMDSYNFIQPWTTTSERETPLYLKDTYYKNSFYNKSANENLLVAGRYGEFGDKTLIMFADNKSQIKFEESEEKKLAATSESAVNFEQTGEVPQKYIPLKRIWKLKNLSQEYSDGEHVSIELPENEGEVEEKFAGSYNIKVKEGANATIDNMPAFVNKGEISWVSGALNGDVTVTLGGQVFKFAASGNISVNGNDVNVSYKRKDLIDVVKKGSVLYVRKNGEIIPSTRVEQNQTPAEWTMEIASKGKAVELNEFHVMSDNVNNDYMELCYGMVESMNLYTNGKIYLLMSDKEDFQDEEANLRIYRMTSKDKTRSKVLFENLDWKTGGEFTYFTFAVSGDPEEEEIEVNKDPVVTETRPACYSQGSIMITFPDDDTYAYTLIGPEKNAVKSSEQQLISGSYEITDLWEGTFKLYTAPFDGLFRFNIVEKDGVKPVNNEKISFKSHFNEKSQLSATWTVGDAQAYSLSGFTRDFDNINIFCGVKIEDGKIYKVENGVVTGEGMSINNGDEVKVVGNDQLQAKVYVQNEFAFDIIHNEYGNLYWAVETADGKTVKNLSLEQISINGWAPVVENVHTQNFVDSEHLSFQEVGLYEEEIEMVCEEGKGTNNRGVENLAVQSSTNGTHKVNLVLTLPSEYKDKEVYVVSPSGSSVPVDVDYVKTEDGSDEFQKQLTIPGDGTYVISVKSGAGTVSKQFIVR
ncbi:MAG: hypothetical protein KIH03_01305 [Paludibacteraceae bacterium]|nr:hypothetical protein [Paludibacteraceae bacterium]